MSTTLNERDSLVDLLSSEKKLMSLYSYAISESEGKGLRKELCSLFECASGREYETYALMENRGYTPKEEVQEDSIEKVRETYAKIKTS